MANAGIAPPDATSDVGKVRFLIPDTTYVALVPPVSGQGDYEWFSDSAIEVFLDLADDDIEGAVAIAWGQIADYYASEAVSVTTDDLRVDLTKRAQFWRNKADAAVVALGADVFALAKLGRSCGCTCHAELAGYWYCGFCSCN